MRTGLVELALPPDKSQPKVYYAAWRSGVNPSQLTVVTTFHEHSRGAAYARRREKALMADRNKDLTVQDALDTFPVETPPPHHNCALSTAIAPRARTTTLLQFPRERVIVPRPASNSFAPALAIVTAVLIAVVAGFAPRQPTLSLLPSTMTASWAPLAVAAVALERRGRQNTTPSLRAGSHRDDTMDIQRVLNRYRDGFSVLDVAAVKTVWPSADEHALRKAFAGLYDQNIEFDSCRISVAATTPTADALCRGEVSYVRNERVKRRRTEVKQWQFTLANNGARWTIRTIIASPRQ